MEKMPPAIRMALAIHNKDSLGNLVEMADTMAKLHRAWYERKFTQ